MKEPIDLAREFLLLADRHLIAARLLAASEAVADEIVGFHAQQATEKALKAVLVIEGVEFRKVHDLEALFRLLTEHGSPLPSNVEDVVWLTPYAVLFRYSRTTSAPLDRGRAIELAEADQAWATRRVG